MRNIIITSNAKKFFCHPDSGRNIGYERYGSQVILGFDIEEFVEAHGKPLPPEIDIIDIGYWWRPFADPLGELQYEPPVWHTREEAAA
jgi:hypothetical protein